jgi:TolB-like protein
MKVLILFLLVWGNVYSQSTTTRTATIDEAIRIAAAEISQKLTGGDRIAVLSFSSEWQELSAYVLEEMNNAIARIDSLTVLTRQELDLLRQELDFQMTDEVSQRSAQRRQFQGAQSALTGSHTVTDGVHIFRIQVIAVGTGAILHSDSFRLRNDRVLRALTHVPRGTSPWVYGTMNIALGLGSYLQGDGGGGFLITSGYAIAIGLIIIELTAMEYEDRLAGVFGTAGLGVAGATLVFGFARPFMFNKNSGLASVMDRVDIVPVYSSQQNSALRITYTHKF